MVNKELNIWDLKEVINEKGYEGTFQYVIPDLQKVNYGQPELYLESLNGRIFAFIRDDNGDTCIREIENEEQLRKLMEVISEP